MDLFITKALQKARGDIYGAAALILASAPPPPLKRRRTGDEEPTDDDDDDGKQLADDESLSPKNEQITQMRNVLEKFIKPALLDATPEKLPGRILGIKNAFEWDDSRLFDFDEWFDKNVKWDYQKKHGFAIEVTYTIDGKTFSGMYPLRQEDGSYTTKSQVINDLRLKNREMNRLLNRFPFPRGKHSTYTYVDHSHLKRDANNLPEKIEFFRDSPIYYLLKIQQYGRDQREDRLDFVYDTTKSDIDLNNATANLKMVDFEDEIEKAIMMERDITKHEQLILDLFSQYSTSNRYYRELQRDYKEFILPKWYKRWYVAVHLAVGNQLFLQYFEPSRTKGDAIQELLTRMFTRNYIALVPDESKFVLTTKDTNVVVERQFESDATLAEILEFAQSQNLTTGNELYFTENT